MLRLERPLVSRVRGAACNGVDHAGASPAAAVARFGCVAVPDISDGRPSSVQAQVKVLGAGKPVRPVRRASETWGRSESEHYSVDMAPTRNRSWGYEQPSLLPAWAKANGHRRRQRAKAVGVCSGVWVVAPSDWSATQSREGLAIARPEAQAARRGQG